jgi:hypothetical protein
MAVDDTFPRRATSARTTFKSSRAVDSKKSLQQCRENPRQRSRSHSREGAGFKTSLMASCTVRESREFDDFLRKRSGIIDHRLLGDLCRTSRSPKSARESIQHWS